MYCQYCGNELASGVTVCPNCGTPVRRQTYYYENSSSKSRLVATILCFFFGGLGAV